MRLTLALLALLLCGCATLENNPTVFPYQINRKILSEANIKRVVIASNNFGAPSRSYLQKKQAFVDGRVADYLRKNGYELTPSLAWDSAWQEAQRQFGNVVDPTTGTLNMQSFKQCFAWSVARLRQNQQADAVLFTDLIERTVSFSADQPHYARWDGVSRKPTLEGAGEGVPEGFKWQTPVNAVSIWVNIVDLNQNILFSSVGGIEVTDALQLRGSTRFSRRKKVLGSDGLIDEGIALALHPFIVMDDYPAPKP